MAGRAHHEQFQVRDVAELNCSSTRSATRRTSNLAREQIKQHEERIAVYEGMRARFGEDTPRPAPAQ